MKIGIVGGGQLGRMLVQAGTPMGHTFVVLDPTPNCPASQVGAEQIIGDYEDLDGTIALTKAADVITFEIERFNRILRDLQFPQARPGISVLETIVDKVEQKRFLQRHGLPVAKFEAVSSPGRVATLARTFKYPLLLKVRQGGFDGRGNKVVNSEEEIQTAWDELSMDWSDFYIENFIPFTKELSVIVVRDTFGRMITYPTVETIHYQGICDLVMSPAPISGTINRTAQRLARKVADALKTVGAMGVEMFYQEYTADYGKLWVNEIAPRVHNSGHWTIDGTDCSQFQNHLLAITGVEIREPQRTYPITVMKNILGQTSSTGFPWGSLEEAAQLPGVTINTYGKDARPRRKIGHINVLGENLEDCLATAEKARAMIQV